MFSNRGMEKMMYMTLHSVYSSQNIGSIIKKNKMVGYMGKKEIHTKIGCKI
jgi:hypothetical protein